MLTNTVSIVGQLYELEYFPVVQKIYIDILIKIESLSLTLIENLAYMNWARFPIKVLMEDFKMINISTCFLLFN